MTCRLIISHEIREIQDNNIDIIVKCDLLFMSLYQREVWYQPNVNNIELEVERVQTWGRYSLHPADLYTSTPLSNHSHPLYLQIIGKYHYIQYLPMESLYSLLLLLFNINRFHRSSLTQLYHINKQLYAYLTDFHPDKHSYKSKKLSA